MSRIAGYRQLSEEEIGQVNALKGLENELGLVIKEMSESGQVDSRCVAIATTEFQSAFMWLNRSITQPASELGPRPLKVPPNESD